MSDSGGLLLNFAATEVSISQSAPKFKGGSWRERARLTRHARSGHARPSENHITTAYARAIRDKSGADGVGGFPQPPAKRTKVGHVNTENRVHQSQPPAHLVGVAKHGSAGVKEVISSLFTSNPASTSAIIAEEKVQTPSKPTNAPLPEGADTFTSLGLNATLAAHVVTKIGIKTPTLVQKTAVTQLVHEDADLFIQSETGSGKTLAYLLPIVQRLMTAAERQRTEEGGLEQGLSRDSGLFAIILAPTRELCKQISLVLDKLLGCAHYLVQGTVQGGEKKKSEKARLRKGINVLVATPGRLVDHIENTQTLDVSKVRYLVLDEGDRLMDMGFEEDITKIVRRLDSANRKSTLPGLPDRRVTVLCSATLKSNVEKLGDLSLKDAVLVQGERSGDSTAEKEGDAFLAPAQLKQSYIICPPKLRLVTLTALLKRTFARKGSVMKAIVFISCADSVDFHFQAFTRPIDIPSDLPPIDPVLSDSTSYSPQLSTHPLLVHRLHGSLPQPTRTAIVKSFSTTTLPALLFATDVASRGLDVPSLNLVIEYDPSFSKEDHLHRVGRTARLGRDGRATVFLLPGPEENYTSILRSSFRTTDTPTSTIQAHSATDILRRGFTHSTLTSTTDHETLATNFQLDIERWVLSDPKTKELAKNAFQSHVRAYATHTAAERPFFDIKALHLGHLAKAFGLREAPGSFNVAGVRKRASRRDMTREENGKAGVDEVDNVDEAAKKMRSLVRNRDRMMGAGAGEFNLA